MDGLASLRHLRLQLQLELFSRFRKASFKKNKIRLALWNGIGYIFSYRDVAQVVARLTGGQEAAGSSPVIPRKKAL